MLLYTTLAVDSLHQVLGMSECSLLLCYFQELNLGITGGLCGDKYIAMYIRQAIPYQHGGGQGLKVQT